MVAYLDFLENFKVFYMGVANVLERVPIADYQATDYLVAYRLGVGSELYVVDRGKRKLLTTIAAYYLVSDSTVVFYDRLTQSFKAYYKETIHELEYVNDENKNFKASDNVIAFISLTGELRVFYRGEIHPLILINSPVTYQTGKNIVTYIDDYTSSLKAFYKDEIVEIEPNKPLSFKTGDDLVAYQTIDWALKVFYDGKVTQLSSYEPKFYEVTDSLVVYQEFNTFKVFYKGKIHTLETNFIPDKYSIDFSTLVYFDQQGRLTAFSNGKKQIVTYEPVNSFMHYRNAIHYRVNNANYVFWKGRSF